MKLAAVRMANPAQLFLTSICDRRRRRRRRTRRCRLRQHLDLADLAGPGARRAVAGSRSPWLRPSRSAAEQLRAEEFRAAAVMRRASPGRCAVLKSPCTAPKSVSRRPEGGDDRPRHAVLLLGPRKGIGVALQNALALLHAVGADDALGEIDEVHAEDALAAVMGEDRLILACAVQHAVGSFRRETLAEGFLLHAGKKLPEVAAALLGERAGAESEEGGERGRSEPRCGSLRGRRRHHWNPRHQPVSMMGLPSDHVGLVARLSLRGDR
jgi:hypothetical protein